MKILIMVSLLAVLFTGCTAEMMETHGTNIQLIHLPNEKPGRGGVVRYLSNGLDVVKNARRSDAEKQMKTVCEGSYKITAEGPRSKFGASMPIGHGPALEFDEYTYIAFECEKPAKKIEGLKVW